VLVLPVVFLFSFPITTVWNCMFKIKYRYSIFIIQYLLTFSFHIILLSSLILSNAESPVAPPTRKMNFVLDECLL
jgi:hypothetical protein